MKSKWPLPDMGGIPSFDLEFIPYKIDPINIK